MKKILNIIKTVILAILFVLYAAIIIGMSTFVLNRNDYGYTRFGENDYLIITKDNASKDYKEGSLVITQMKLIDELKVGDKIFVYKTNDEKQEVYLTYTKVEEIVSNPSTKYIKITDGTAWGEEFIAGQAIECYDNLGFIIGALQTKWLFFGLLIVPVFFILMFEIYNFIITIKYDEDEDENIEDPKEENKTVEEKPVEVKEEVKEINEEIKEQVVEEKPLVEEQKEQKEEDNTVTEVTEVVEKHEEVSVTIESNDEEVL